MNHHLPILVITSLLMLTMIVQAYRTDAMDKKMRLAFVQGFIMIVVCSFLDYGRLMMNGSETIPIWLHSLVVSLECSCAPFIVLCLIGMLGEIRKNTFLVYLFVLNVILQMTTGFTEWIFYIDASNYFMRGDWFRFYVLIYAIGIVTMYREVYRCSKVYQNCNGLLLLFSIVSLTIGVGMNEFAGEFYTTFLSVSIASVLFYLYFVEITVQTDPLTRLLNRRSYNNHLKKLDYTTTIVMFDVNKFKEVNDTYGHDIGDLVLQQVARCLRKSFGGVGYIYRLGGDEFCLILHKGVQKKVSIEQLRRSLERNLSRVRRQYPFLPSVSMGDAVYDGTEDVAFVLNRADQNMYINKNGHSKF